MLNFKKKNVFILVSILYFFCYIFFANFLINTSTSDINYKNFSSTNSCKYTINQIDFYDFEETDKTYQIYKYHVNFLKDIESIKCINKIELIEDGWPVVKIQIYGDSLLFQIIKNSGLLIIFILFLNFYPNNKKLFLLFLICFNFANYLLFSIDFISQEFKFLYSYEIIFLEIFIIFFIFLRHTDYDFLKKILFSLQYSILNINNKNIIIFSTLIGIRSVYIFFSHTYANNIADWLTNYNFGYIRRGLSGTILLAISDDLNFIAYSILPVLIFFLHFFVVYISLKIFQENNKNIYSFFLLFSPLYIMFPLYNVSKGVGNKELLGIICFLLILRSTYRKIDGKFYILITALYTVSVLSHEINLFMTAFLAVLFILKKINLNLRLFITLLIISLIFVAIYFIFPTSPETVNSLCNETYLNIKDLDCTKAYYLGQDSLDSINSSINRIFEDSDYILVFGVYFIFGLLPFYFDGWIKQNYKLFILILLSMFPLFLIAIDWGRWLHILILSLTAIYFTTNTETSIKSLNLSNLILLLLYSTLWRVPQCCVQEINLVYLFRFNKFNYLIYMFLIYTLLLRKKEAIEKINEYIKF